MNGEPFTTRRSGAILAALLAVMLCGALAQAIAYWPGIMIYDAIRQYGQALSGRFDDWHPPMFEALWRQLIPLQRGPAPMLVVQLLLYWTGFALLAGWALRQGRRGLAIALAACAFLPIPFALVGAVMKDAMMAGALLAATGLIATGSGRVQRGAAIALLIFAVTLRFNAFLAAWPLLVVALPEAWRSTRLRFAVLSAAALIPLLLALPVANRLLHAERSGVELSLIIYDLGGITEHSGVDVFPPQPVADPVAVNHRCYSPKKWDTYAWWVDAPCAIGFDSIRATFQATGQNPTRLWLSAIIHHPIAYAEHRLRHFNVNSRFLVRGDVERPVFAQSDPNRWNIASPPSALRDAIDQLALLSADTPLGWPIWWMALAAGVLLIGQRLPSRVLMMPIAWSSLLYGLGYLVFSVASEMRYHFWTMSAALIAVVIAGADLAAGAEVPRRRLLVAAVPVLVVTLAGVLWRLN